ncbi:MAG: GFA family protein [Hyphomicrobium sp.]|uniref:GFA family protein n=1 Tax=Hyphomicrobium sp. TaxID=82 RepID=UPI003D149985
MNGFLPAHGGCLCGALRYRISAPPLLADICHCVQCRKQSGAPYLPWIAVAAAEFAWIKGKPARFESSPGNYRHFCADCGSPVVMTGGLEPDKYGVTIGSLDEPNRFPPTVEAFTVRRLAWLHPMPGLAQHERGNPDF